MRERLSDYQEEAYDLYNLRLLLQSLPLTVWQSMIRSAIPILSPRERKGKRPIIPTALTFL